MARRLVVLMLALFTAAADAAPRLDQHAVESATFSDRLPRGDRASPLLVKIEVLLDRARFSPGQIDGRLGENVKKALAAYAEAHALPAPSPLGKPIVAALAADTRPILTTYVVTEADLNGPFTAQVPARMEKMQGMKWVGYRNAREALAEKFHVSEPLLAELNPGMTLDHPGQTIVVPNVLVDDGGQPVTRIEVDGNRQTVSAYAQSGQLVAFYPATVGSEEKPSPTGTLKIVSIDRNPHYRYNPKYRFKGIKSRKPFEIGPGPNNPVGLVWIGLSAEGYGIHGTPDPSRVSKSESHGCVRLTNWDALALAALVKKGVPVQFGDGSGPAGSTSPAQ